MTYLVKHMKVKVAEAARNEATRKAAEAAEAAQTAETLRMTMAQGPEEEPQALHDAVMILGLISLQHFANEAC